MKKLMVALVTPFTRDNKVDYKSMDRILHRLLKEGCDGFIVCGTTAETPTLSHNEKLSIAQRYGMAAAAMIQLRRFWHAGRRRRRQLTVYCL